MTLVLLHPLGTDRHIWDPVLPLLDGDVVAIDMPGFGAEPPLRGEETVTPRELAAAIAERLGVDTATAGGNGAEGAVAPGGGGSGLLGVDTATAAGNGPGGSGRLGVDTTRAGGNGPGGGVSPAGLAASAIDVAGISLGGWVALEMAAAGWARSVTAIAPAGMWSAPLAPKRSTARLAARAARPVLPRLLRSERGRRAALIGTMAHPERVPYPDALRIVRAYADASGFEAANRGMRAGRFTGFDDIDVPLTLAWPEFDKLVSRPAHVPETAQEFFLAGCGHMPTYDDPGQVAQVLRAGAAGT